MKVKPKDPGFAPQPQQTAVSTKYNFEIVIEFLYTLGSESFGQKTLA
jgi:hypothetical protein